MPEQELPQNQTNLPEEDSYNVGSLSDYIARHLQKRNTPQLEKSQESMPQLAPQGDSYPSSKRTGSGMVLHHLDTQLVGDHLEQYLPTPSTRYHMIRERLGNELKEIYQELNQYRQFSGNEYQDKIDAREKRASLLQRKIFELDLKISKLNPFQSMYKTLQMFAMKAAPEIFPPGKSSGWTIIPNRDRLQDEVASINQQLQSLQHILEEQLHDPSFTAQQLGRLINQYDINLKKAEKLTEELRNRKSFGAQLGDKITGWYRSFYSK
jgi:hypothetical protein